MKRNRLAIFSVTIIALLLAGLWFANKVSQDETVVSQLTGVKVDPEVAERPVLGVMVGNSAEARPQTGLDSAGIVFEAVTEGGITRYLALYQEASPSTIGPVRSLRVHFLDWAMGFDASIAHVGGSKKALDMAEERGAKSLNQFKYSKAYYRDNGRDAPHNVFARTNDLRALQDEQDHGKSVFADIPRSNDNPSKNPLAGNITVDFSGPTYKVRFVYDPATNSYTRYLAGKPDLDEATQQPITVKNVIVITMSDDRSAKDGALGGGEALFFKDGNVHSVLWEKPGYDERIKLVDTENVEVSWNRGDTWIAAIPDGRPVTY